MRKLASFFLWLGLFGLFLSAAAYTVGSLDDRLLLGSVALIAFGWLVLRRPRKESQPSRRFRLLRRLGLLAAAQEQLDEE